MDSRPEAVALSLRASSKTKSPLESASLVLRWFKRRLRRPLYFTWTSIAGFLVAFHGDLQILPLVIPVALVTFSNIYAIYFFNDITDYSVDTINDPQRTKLLTEIGKPTAYAVVVLLMAFGLAVGYTLGTVPFMLGLLLDALGLAYSIPMIAFKNRFVVKTLTIALGATIASLLGGVVAGQVDAVLLPAVGAFVYLFAVSPLSDLVDIKGDIGASRRTIPIIVGARRTVLLSILMAEIPVASTLLFSGYLGFSVLAPIAVSGVGLAAFAILYPLLNKFNDPRSVKGTYKRMFALHFFLQGSFVLGAL